MNRLLRLIVVVTSIVCSAGGFEVCSACEPIAISGGDGHVVMLTRDGSVMVWGSNLSGQLGDGTLVNAHLPQRVVLPDVAIAVVAGERHTLAVDAFGSVWAWGSNTAGQLGDGTNTSSPFPVQTQNLSDVVALAGYDNHSLALRSDGSVWSWGDNGYGQLGDGTTVDRLVPVQVVGLTNVVAIAARTRHSLAVRNDGTVWSWGYNSSGQLGDGTNTSSTLPVPVIISTPDVVAIAAGDNHSLALRGDGSILAWGNNSAGQLGDGTRANANRPVVSTLLISAATISAGDEHSLAVAIDDTLWAWGHNGSGQIGDGTQADALVPIQVPTMAGTAFVGQAAGRLNTVAVKNDGTVWAWGYNCSGEAGVGTGSKMSFPVVADRFTNVSHVSNSVYFALAVRQDGALLSVGSNTFGQLGDGTTTSRTEPAIVPGLSDVSAAAAFGQGGFSEHSLALTGGVLWSWGRNERGQLGNGTLTDSHSPSLVSAPTGFTEVASGRSLSLALHSDGTVWSWGYNFYGQLGNGSTSNRSLPRQLIAPDSVVSLVSSASHVLALDDAGSVWTWGYNGQGQLGDGSVNNSSVPRVVSGLPPALAIAAGGQEFALGHCGHSIALDGGGGVWTWGCNREGQLGDGTYTDRSNPGRITLPCSAVAVAAGLRHSLARCADGTVWGWGDNGTGQIGVGQLPSSTSEPVLILGHCSGAVRIAAGGEASYAWLADGTVLAWGETYMGTLGIGETCWYYTPVQVPLEIAPGHQGNVLRGFQDLDDVVLCFDDAPSHLKRVYRDTSKLAIGVSALAPDVPRSWYVDAGAISSTSSAFYDLHGVSLCSGAAGP